MEIWLQQVVNGLSVGMGYALVGLGLTLIFGVLHVVNFAHGELFLMGGTAAVITVLILGLPYPLAIALGVLFGAVLAFIYDRVAIRPVLDRPGGFSTALLATYAASLLTNQIFFFTWGNAPEYVPGIQGVLNIGGVAVTYQKLLVLAAGLMLLLAIDFALRRSIFGLELRAVAQDAFAARAVGISVTRVRSLTFITSGAMAGFAGALLTPVSLFSITMGANVLIMSFAVVIIGGMGSARGAVGAGLLVGVLEALMTRAMPAGYVQALIYSLLVVLLIVRPEGLFKTGSR